MFLLLLSITACSKSNDDILEESPDYIKVSWDYYSAMCNVIDAVAEGENVKVAFDKYLTNEKEIVNYYENATSENEEEQLVIDNIHMMHLSLFTMAIENFNASLGAGAVDIEEHLYKLQVPRYELEKIYKNYGLEYLK